MRDRNRGLRGGLAEVAGVAAWAAAVAGAWGIVQGFLWSAAGKGFWSGFGWGFGEVFVILTLVFLAQPVLSAALRRLH